MPGHGEKKQQILDALKENAFAPKHLRKTLKQMGEELGVSQTYIQVVKRKAVADGIIQRQVQEPKKPGRPPVVHRSIEDQLRAEALEEAAGMADESIQKAAPLLGKLLDGQTEILTTQQLLQVLSEVAQSAAGTTQINAVKLLNDLKAQHAPEEERGPGQPRSREEMVERLAAIFDAAGWDLTKEALNKAYPPPPTAKDPGSPLSSQPEPATQEPSPPTHAPHTSESVASADVDTSPSPDDATPE